MLLGFIHNLLQARFIFLAAPLEFFILFYSCQSGCKPARNKLANKSITKCLNQNNEHLKGENGGPRAPAGGGGGVYVVVVGCASVR